MSEKHIYQVVIDVKKANVGVELPGEFCIVIAQSKDSIVSNWIQLDASCHLIWNQQLSLDLALYKKTQYQQKRGRIQIKHRLKKKEKLLGKTSLDFAELINARRNSLSVTFDRGPLLGTTLELGFKFTLREEESSVGESVSSLTSTSLHQLMEPAATSKFADSPGRRGARARSPADSKFMPDLDDFENTQLFRENVELKSLVQNLKNQIEALKKQKTIAQVDDRELKDVRIQLEAHKLENNKLRAELSQAQRKVAELEIQEGVGESNKEKDLKIMIFERDEKLKGMEKHLLDLKNETLDLKKEVDRRKKDYQEVLMILKGSPSEIQLDNARLRESNSQLEQSMEDIRKSMVQASSIHAGQLRKMELRMRKAEADKLGAMETLRSSNHIITELRAELGSLRGRAAAAELESKTLRQQLQQTTQELAEKYVAISTLSSTNLTLRSEMDAFQQESYFTNEENENKDRNTPETGKRKEKRTDVDMLVKKEISVEDGGRKRTPEAFEISNAENSVPELQIENHKEQDSEEDYLEGL